MADPHFEVSIADDHRIFEITATDTFTLVDDLLPADVKAYLDEGRLVMDGYAYSTLNAWSVSDIYNGGVFEVVAANERYVLPIVSWQKKTMVKSNTGGNLAILIRMVIDRGTVRNKPPAGA